jgi:glycerol-3-phosphate acyltransferase PlsY
VDLRTAGSGNIGATNAFRVLGGRWGALVFLLDVVKGTAAALLAASLPTQIAAGVAAILGHVFSPWVRFKGGRGVATSLGVFLAILPAPTLLAFGLWVVLVALSGRVSVGSIVAAIAYPFLVAAFLAGRDQKVTLLVVSSLIAALILVRHLPNIRRLLTGSEPRTFGRKAPKGERP